MSSNAKPVHTPAGADEYPALWRWSRLDDICDGVVDCPHSTPTLTSVGPLVARSQDIRAGVLDTEAAAHVSEATYRERIARAEPRHGDLLYSREGTYFGIAAEVPKDTQVCLGQRMVLIRPEPSQVNCRYLKYWLNSPAIVSHIRGFRDGSVAERLNLPVIRGLPVALPPLSEQDRIADVLGCLDEKIGLNRRTSRTLESMARAVFKSWFIDFDPVHRKVEGGEVGLPSDLAALFPPRFCESRLGEIPEGWEVRPLGDLLELRYGKALKAGDRRGGIIPVFGSNGLVGWHDQALARGPGIVIGRKGNPGVVTFAPSDFFAIDTAFFAVPKPACQGLHFLLHALREQGLASLAADSAVPGLNRSLAYGSLQVLSPEPLRAAFESYAWSIACLVTCRDGESRVLTELRDALLPRLMAGSAAEAQTGAPIAASAGSGL